MDGEAHNLFERAKAVLKKNRTPWGTRPSSDLYPHQWSWDAAFIALGLRHFAPEEAEKELQALFSGQWRHGLLPHMVFHTPAPDYHPGPAFWQTNRSRFAPPDILTSGIIQPPLHATAVWRIYQTHSSRAREFLEEMFPRLVAWHRYLREERDPSGTGLLYIRHPWESGQDNSPLWDRPLARITLTPDEVPRYRRVDTRVIGAVYRPNRAQYDRYAYLVRIAYEHDYEESRIRTVSPFLVQDVLFNTLWAQANQDLAKIAQVLGQSSDPFQRWARETIQAMNRFLWDPKEGFYRSKDLRTGEWLLAPVASGGVPLFAGVPSRDQALQLVQTLQRLGFLSGREIQWVIPSLSPRSPAFSSVAYWRGPVWVNLNWLYWHGLHRYGFEELAARVRKDTLALVRRSGFFEHYDPRTGEGHGARNFSWSAALTIDLLASPSP